jgi:hypothetical protein
MDNPLPISMPPEASPAEQNPVPVFAPITMEKIEQVPDAVLLTFCRQYGRDAILLHRKFIGLLPEVNRRRLYEKKGFSSIYHFAAVLGGVSREQVNRVINMEETLKDKPICKALLVEGKVSINKFSRAPIITKENDAEVAKSLQVLSQKTLEIMRKDERACARAQAEKEQAKLFEPTASVPGHKFALSEELLKKLDELHAQGKDISKVILEALELRTKDIQERKQEAASRLPEESGRYITKEIRDLQDEEYGNKCAYTGCTRPAEQIHHQVRFGLQSLNNPLYMVPLCAEHHKIAHAIDLIVVKKWRT